MPSTRMSEEQMAAAVDVFRKMREDVESAESGDSVAFKESTLGGARHMLRAIFGGDDVYHCENRAWRTEPAEDEGPPEVETHRCAGCPNADDCDLPGGREYHELQVVAGARPLPTGQYAYSLS